MFPSHDVQGERVLPTEDTHEEGAPSQKRAIVEERVLSCEDSQEEGAAVVRFVKQPAEKDCVNDLNSLVMLELCKKLNIECAVGCDYRDLAAHFEMISDDIRLISQGKEQTQEVLKWVGRKPENTVAKLREKLVEMERDDCVAIIDKEYKCEEVPSQDA